MRILVNEEEVQAVPTEVGNFKQLIEHLTGQLCQPGEVITTLQLNGEEIPYVEEKNYYDLGLEDIEELTVNTAHPQALALEGLTDAEAYFTNLREGLLGCASALRSGNLKQGLLLFQRCLEVTSWAIELFRGISRSLLVDYARILVDEGKSTVQARLAQTTDVLHEVMDAQEMEDWILLADLLEYELEPRIAALLSSVPAIRTKVESLDSLC